MIYLTYVILTRQNTMSYFRERKFISFEYWVYMSQLDSMTLCMGMTPVSNRQNFQRLRMVWHGSSTNYFAPDGNPRSVSVNSIDVVFNFDCIGFTGTPFIDNYPTFSTSTTNANYLNSYSDRPPSMCTVVIIFQLLNSKKDFRAFKVSEILW